jgi:hypothetical protein
VDVPRTLLVTNDYRPAWRDPAHAEALVRLLPPTGSRSCVRARGRDAFDDAAPYRVPPARTLPVAPPRRGAPPHEAVRSFGPRWSCSARSTARLLGPSLRRPGPLYSRRRTGSNTGSRSRPGPRARPARHVAGGAGAGDVQRVHRAVVRTAVPDDVPVSVMYPARISRRSARLPYADLTELHASPTAR